MSDALERKHQQVRGILSRRCEHVISAELARLGRRQPSLSPAQRAVVADSLTAVADRLLLDAVRRSPCRVDTVEALWALGTTRATGEEGAP